MSVCSFFVQSGVHRSHVDFGFVEILRSYIAGPHMQTVIFLTGQNSSQGGQTTGFVGCNPVVLVGKLVTCISTAFWPCGKMKMSRFHCVLFMYKEHGMKYTCLELANGWLVHRKHRLSLPAMTMTFVSLTHPLLKIDLSKICN